MKNLLPLTASALFLCGCASSPPAPEWQSQAFAALTSYTAAYLSGNTRVADVEFNRAKTEIARTGRPDLMARIELVRCATQVASLDITPCAGYQALALDAPPGEQAYASFIAGRWTTLEAALLPLPYRPLVTQTQSQTRQESDSSLAATNRSRGKLHQIQDPLARLVAAGALLQREPLATVDIELAVETASGQGWRRPLLAWLGVQLKHQQTAGEADAAAKTQRRIDLVLQKN